MDTAIFPPGTELPPATMEAKRKEGHKLMASGMKYEKTGLTRWKPDFNSALTDYEQAILCFKAAKDHVAVAEASSKAAEASCGMDIFANAARHYEGGAQALKEVNDLVRSADFFEKAARMYREEGAVEKAAGALCKGARVVEVTDLERAAAMFRNAALLLEDDDTRPVEFSIDPLRQASSFFLRVRKLDDAIKVLEQQMNAHWVLRQGETGAKCALSKVIAHLHADDFVGGHAFLMHLLADKTKSDITRVEEVRIAERILGAFMAQSAEDLDTIIKSRSLHFLEPQALKLARQLTLQTAAVPVAMATASSSAASALPPLPPPPPGVGVDEAIASQGPPKPTGDFGEEVDEFTEDLT